ncbi:hypothetical protein MTR_7g498320 [Medicago truncatula]|uniref:F-box domain-containing protein n=2 Tax=Medicago truncatula TaxID=3880 RepID=A0A072U3N5_MEDTR|nr:hypothetical protein MTR_7g498320 [Medicago truncatula]
MAQPNEREEQNDTVSSKRQQLITSTESPLPSLTFDLIAEILSRLPVKLLLQLQCLGKFWKSLISDPKFAKKHLQSWRHHLMCFPYSGYIHGSGIFVSGTVNWLAFNSPNSVAIVSLDLENKSYQNLGSFEGNFHNLGVLKDCLCIYTRNIMFFDVWVLKECGNKESWTKFYSVPYMEDQGSFSYTKALYISEDDRILVDFRDLGSNEVKLVVYIPKMVLLIFLRF